MSDIKRINLSFDLKREQDRQAYSILKDKSQKTFYVIQAVLAYEKVSKKDGELSKLKEALREVLQEMNFTAERADAAQDNNIPEEVFQIFEDL